MDTIMISQRDGGRHNASAQLGDHDNCLNLPIEQSLCINTLPSPTPSFIPKDFESEAMIDSGYNTQSTTPDKDSSEERPANASFAEDGKTMYYCASGYQFYAFGSLKKRILLDVNVDEATNERFKVVQTHFERLLLEHIRLHNTAGAKYKPMSTRLVMIGTSSFDAVPYLAVFCQPEQKRLVEQFATKRIVKDICDPSDHNAPSFKIKVIGNAPRLRLSDLPVKVLADHSHMKLCGTLCGTPIQFVHPFRKANATFGGIIEIVAETGDMKLYGITTGHAVEEWHNESQPAKEVANANEGDTDRSIFQPAIDELPCNEAKVQELDLEYLPDTDSDVEMNPPPIRGTPSDIGSDKNEGRWSFAQPLIIGSVVAYAGALEDTEDGTNTYYDWALFETDDCKPNHVPGLPNIDLVLSDHDPGNTADRSVYVIANGSDYKLGQLSAIPGRILLGSGEQFVDTYMVTLSDGEGRICDGDSGSWVIDCGTFEVYGHLVASDMLGFSYVVPMKAIFADIKRRLRAQLVTLPSAADIPTDINMREEWTSNVLNAPKMTMESTTSIDSGYSSKTNSPADNYDPFEQEVVTVKARIFTQLHQR